MSYLQVSIIVFCSLIAVIIFQTCQIEDLKSKNQLLEMRIKIADEQRQDIVKKYDIAKNSAENEMRHIQDESKNIMKQKVSKNCEEAIKWGIDKAKRFDNHAST